MQPWIASSDSAGAETVPPPRETVSGTPSQSLALRSALEAAGWRMAPCSGHLVSPSTENRAPVLTHFLYCKCSAKHHTPRNAEGEPLRTFSSLVHAETGVKLPNLEAQPPETHDGVDPGCPVLCIIYETGADAPCSLPFEAVQGTSRGPAVRSNWNGFAPPRHYLTLPH